MFFHLTQWRHWLLSILVDEEEFVSHFSEIEIVQRQIRGYRPCCRSKEKGGKNIKGWFFVKVWPSGMSWCCFESGTSPTQRSMLRFPVLRSLWKLGYMIRKPGQVCAIENCGKACKWFDRWKSMTFDVLSKTGTIWAHRIYIRTPHFRSFFAFECPPPDLHPRQTGVWKCHRLQLPSFQLAI